MKGNNYHHKVITGVALKPQVVNGATAVGPAIEEPWKRARQLAFQVLGGDFAATVDGRLVVEGQRRDDNSWEALKENDGDTPAIDGDDAD